VLGRATAAGVDYPVLVRFTAPPRPPGAAPAASAADDPAGRPAAAQRAGTTPSATAAGPAGRDPLPEPSEVSTSGTSVQMELTRSAAGGYRPSS
jgi:hypothetical protein